MAGTKNFQEKFGASLVYASNQQKGRSRTRRNILES